MKIFIIILFILILVYIILKKKETFETDQRAELKKYYDENPNLKIEEINEKLGVDNTNNEMPKSDYIRLIDEYDLDRFVNLFTEKNMIFLTDSDIGLGFQVRDNLFTTTLVPIDSDLAYNFFIYNFKRITVDTLNMNSVYDNPNNVDYIPLFIQKFKPNVSLKLNFKKPSDEIRIRYEILKKQSRDVISSGYLAYDKRGVRDFDDSLIQQQVSPMNKMYEPHEGLLSTGTYLNKYNELLDGNTYSNHYINLHKLIYDVRDSTEQSDYDTIRKKFRISDNYKFAFENLNQINKNKFEAYSGDYYDLEKDGDVIKQTQLKQPTEGEKLKGKNIIFDTENCLETFTEFYISPGDYTMNIILDKVEKEDYEDGVLVSMEYNINSAADSDYKVIKDNTQTPIHLLKLNNFNNINRSDTSYYIKNNIYELIKDLKSIGTFIKLENGTIKVDKNKMNLIKPERFEPYILINLFRLLLKFRIMKEEETGEFNYLMSKLDKFYASYLMGYLDTRTVGDQGSREYKIIERQLEDLTRKGNLTVQEEQLIHNLQQQLFEMKDVEIERIYGEKPPNLKKIEELNLFSDVIYDYSNSADKKKDLDTELEQLEELNEHNVAISNLDKPYFIEQPISLNTLESAVGKEIILETYKHDSNNIRYVQMAPDGKNCILDKPVYIKLKGTNKYLSQSKNPKPGDTSYFAELTGTPTPITISQHNVSKCPGGGKCPGYYISFNNTGHNLVHSGAEYYVYTGDPDKTGPGTAWRDYGHGRFFPVRTGKDTYNLFNFNYDKNVAFKKNGGPGNNKYVNWGIKADGNTIKADFRTVNNPDMEWEITSVNPSEVMFRGYAFDNTTTGKNVFKLLKNEDNTYSLEYKKGNQKMYVDYSKYYLTLNPDNTDKTKFAIHKGDTDEYVEFRNKGGPEYKVMFHYYVLTMDWPKVNEDLKKLAGPTATTGFPHLSRDGELAGDFSGAPENRRFYIDHSKFGTWPNFKIYTVVPAAEGFTGSIEHFSEDPISLFRAKAAEIITQNETKKEGLNLETNAQRAERVLQSSTPEVSLDFNSFMKVYNALGSDNEVLQEILKARKEGINQKTEDLKNAISTESLNELDILKSLSKRDKMIDIIKIYVHKFLKDTNGNGSIEIYFNNLMNKFDNDKVDEEGKTLKINMSNDPMDYKKPEYSSFNFSIEIKKDPVFTITKEKKEEELIKDDISDVDDIQDDVDAFTLLIRKILTEIKKDFRQIIKTKNYEYLSPLLENLLRDVHMKSKNQIGESQKKMKRVIEIILNLVNKIKDGSIDDINDLLDRRVKDYKFPAEILQENFSNYNTMNPNIIEHFDSDYHKHGSDGRIDFDLQWGNPLLKENEGRYDEYSLLSDLSKTDVKKSYDKMENVLKKASNMVNNFTVGMEAKINSYNESKIEKSTDHAINQLDGTLQDMAEDNYDEKEQEQREKLNRITNKVKELETIQSKAYVGDSKEFNSIKSFGDGQIISIKNMKNDIYNILLNGECLSYDKRNNVQILPCNSSKNQQFQLNNITDLNQYNNIITKNEQEPVGEFDGISYPFSMVNPVLHTSQCLTLNGNSVGVKDCMNSNKQRWEGLKNIKICDKL